MDEEQREPLSPTSQILETNALSLCIHGVVEMDEPLHIPHAKQAIKDLLLAKIPRFSCIMRKDKNGMTYWEKTEVKMDDHVFVPEFPPGLEQYDDYVNEYISSVDMRQLSKSRPLWEYHLINYRTSNAEATTILKLHHTLGDGMSIMSLAFDCFTTASDTQPPYHLSPSPATNFPYSDMQSQKFGSSLHKLWHTLVKFMFIMWYTFEDLLSLLKRQLKWVEDSNIPMKGHPGVEHLPRVFSHTTFNMDDILHIKNSVGGTLNDVLMGVVFSGLQRYLRITLLEGEDKCLTGMKIEDIRLTALALADTRSRSATKKVDIKRKWGNRFTFLSVPIPMSRCPDPLDCVRKAKHSMDRNKMSLAPLIISRVLRIITKCRGPKASGKAMYNTLSSATLTLSNLVGPREVVRLAGYRVKSLFFFVSGAPQTVVLTCISYMGSLRMEVAAVKGYADARLLAACFKDCFAEMKAAASS